MSNSVEDVTRPRESVPSADVEAAVEAWHSGAGEGLELHEYLGWTWEQYARWVDDCTAPNEEPGPAIKG